MKPLGRRLQTADRLGLRGKLWQVAWMKTGLMMLVFCAGMGLAGALHAQTSRPVTFQPTQPISLVTTGGVAYAEYTWTMGGCL